MCPFLKKNDSLPIKVLKIIGMVILGAAGMVLLALLFGYAVMWLWNWLMPVIFGLPVINFWQSVGIVILARIIFGGFKHTGGHKDRSCKHSPKSNSGDRYSHNWRKWKQWDNYWNEEGEKAFDDYVAKKQATQE